MPLLDILFGNTPTLAKVGVMTLDASLDETHERSAQVSQNEIEDGSSITDHVKLDPIRLSINGLVSDSPISLIESAIGVGESLVTGAITGIGGAIAGSLAGRIIGSLSGLITGTPRDPQDAFNYLEELWRTREPFTIVTQLRRYDNMIISNLTVPRSKSIGKSVQFTINAEEVRIVKSSIVQIPSFQLAEAVKAGGQSLSKVGKQAAKEATEGTASNASLLLQGFQKVGFLN